MVRSDLFSPNIEPSLLILSYHIEFFSTEINLL